VRCVRPKHHILCVDRVNPSNSYASFWCTTKDRLRCFFFSSFLLGFLPHWVLFLLDRSGMESDHLRTSHWKMNWMCY
jgi:hypothetical protein